MSGTSSPFFGHELTFSRYGHVVISAAGETVAECAARTTGSRWGAEGTGGGCEVLSTRLEGGIVLVLEQNLCVPKWHDTAIPYDRDWTLGAYRHDAWTGEADDTEPIVADCFFADLTPATLERALATLISALPTLLRL